MHKSSHHDLMTVSSLEQLLLPQIFKGFPQNLNCLFHLGLLHSLKNHCSLFCTFLSLMTLSIFQCLVLMPNGELQSCLSVWGLLGCEVLSRDQSVFHLFFLKFRFSSFSIGLWELWQKVDLLQFLDFIDFIDPVFIEKREKTKKIFSIDNYR